MLGAIQAGLGIAGGLQGLLGGGGGGRSGLLRYLLPYLNNSKFSYTPDENDSELKLLRSRAQRDQGFDRMRTTDELSRAGMLGSGAAYGVLGEQEKRGLRQLEDINEGVFARRREEALGLHKDKMDFIKSLLLGQQEVASRKDLLGYAQGQDDLRDLAGFGGEQLERYLSQGGLRRALLDASDYTPELPALRRR